MIHDTGSLQFNDANDDGCIIVMLLRSPKFLKIFQKIENFNLKFLTDTEHLLFAVKLIKLQISLL